MAAEKKTKTSAQAPAKNIPATQKAAPKKPAAEKVATPKPATPKAAPKKPAVEKAASKKVVETMMIQAAGYEWDTAAVKEQVIADYVAAGHQKSSISSLTVYIKPEERKAYYVINGKDGGSVDI